MYSVLKRSVFAFEQEVNLMQMNTYLILLLLAVISCL